MAAYPKWGMRGATVRRNLRFGRTEEAGPCGVLDFAGAEGSCRVPPGDRLVRAAAGRDGAGRPRGTAP
jgi:hypothetical protein